jgi:hypothetical protein
LRDFFAAGADRFDVFGGDFFAAVVDRFVAAFRERAAALTGDFRGGSPASVLRVFPSAMQ